MDYKTRVERLKNIFPTQGTSGLTDTYLNGVSFFWTSEPIPRTPLMCNPGIVIIGQGHKTGYLNGKEFRYDKDNYLIVSVPTAFECETSATKDNPLLGLFIEIDISRLNHLIEKIEKHRGKFTFKGSDIFCGIEPIKIDIEMDKALEKLISCLSSPMDSDVMGDTCVDEILYRTLLGNHGKALVALTKQETHYAKIAQSLSHIHLNYMKSISIDDLAFKANMSPSSFHRAFKFVTGETPLQYIKKTRLTRARFMIIREGLRVGAAANKVGYESIPQFSREFKRYFKVSPSSAKDGAYAGV